MAGKTVIQYRTFNFTVFQLKLSGRKARRYPEQFVEQTTVHHLAHHMVLNNKNSG